ncbi:MAG: allantoinase AllB [Chitinophagaceae bacterium]|nr:MAG: allantoinase AllB [Chitinophagaceae bacterium]
MLHSRRCYIDGTFTEATVEIQDGKISRVIRGTSAKAGATDFGDAVLMPGCIDAHVHVNEPGRTDWEGWDSATQAGSAGGITTIVEMPLNASPVTIDRASFEAKQTAMEGKLHVNVGLYGGLVPQNRDRMTELAECGVLGIKAFLTHSGIDEFPNVTAEDLDVAMPVLAQLGLPLLVHCELDAPGTTAALQNDPRSYAAYLASRPTSWENEAIRLMIDCCRKYNCPVHIVHVSSAEALALIETAKSEGLPLTSETCPQYILFNAEAIPDGQTVYKCAPPIREAANNARLRAALKSGVLDFLASDHSPAPPETKEIESGNLLKAWGGIAGLQYLLPASWTALRGELSLEQFIPLLTEAPARFLGMDHRKGYIREGYDADLLLWQPESTFTPTATSTLHRHKISPYIDRPLYGVVAKTIVNGAPVWNGAQIELKQQGQWLSRK